jgi:hypothetical protein
VLRTSVCRTRMYAINMDTTLTVLPGLRNSAASLTTCTADQPLNTSHVESEPSSTAKVVEIEGLAVSEVCHSNDPTRETSEAEG